MVLTLHIKKQNMSLVSYICQINNKGTQAQIYLVIYIQVFITYTLQIHKTKIKMEVRKRKIK